MRRPPSSAATKPGSGYARMTKGRYAFTFSRVRHTVLAQPSSSSPRKRGSSVFAFMADQRHWIPVFAGMTEACVALESKSGDNAHLAPRTRRRPKCIARRLLIAGRARTVAGELRDLRPKRRIAQHRFELLHCRVGEELV